MNKFSPVMLLLIFSCNSQDSILQKIGTLPGRLKENSAVEMVEKSNMIWTLQDAGNTSEIFSIDRTGNITHSVIITNATNIDWEDLTSDSDGNLYIGDFGNNDNDRKDLTIYKIDALQLEKKEATASEKITFYYPEQTEFPPKKTARIYDVEAFFVSNGSFYLFTKNRSSVNSGTTMLYKVPNRSGNHAAQLMGTFKTCDFDCAITGADISPDGTKAALLSSSCVWIFAEFVNDDFFKGNVRKIDLSHTSQKEGISFSGNDKLLITDERKKKDGGNLYEMQIELKPKP